MEDNKSKFGTLIQIQRPLYLSPNLTYYMQVGRTLVKAELIKDFNLWDKLMGSPHENIQQLPADSSAE